MLYKSATSNGYMYWIFGLHATHISVTQRKQERAFPTAAEARNLLPVLIFH